MVFKSAPRLIVLEMVVIVTVHMYPVLTISSPSLQSVMCDPLLSNLSALGLHPSKSRLGKTWKKPESEVSSDDPDIPEQVDTRAGLVPSLPAVGCLGEGKQSIPA